MDILIKGKIQTALKTCLCATLIPLPKQKRKGLVYRRDEKESESLSILTLNINSIDTKREELEYQLLKHRPSIFCLQETHRAENGRKLFVKGYKVLETYQDHENSNLGMSIGYRNKANIIVDIKEKTDNLIVMSIKTKAGKLIVRNIYVPCKGKERKAALDEAAKCLLKYSKNEKYNGVLILGDWNQEPEITTKLLTKRGTVADISTCPKNGTRYRRNRRLTSKPIDYAISNTKGLIISQVAKRDWYISDHVPILVRTVISCSEKENVPTLRFDRLMLLKDNIKKIIRNIPMPGNINEMNGQESITSFDSDLRKLLNRLRVLKMENQRERPIWLPDRITKLIEEKRLVNAQVAKGILPNDAYETVKLAVKKAIKEYKRAQYLKYINKGIGTMRANRPRDMWKWLKRNAGIRRGNPMNTAIIDHIRNTVVNESSEKLEVWVTHFENLSIKVDTGTVAKDYKVCTNIETITDSPVTWDEVATKLKCTANWKAPGDDGVPSELYKLVQNERTATSNLARYILLILQKTFIEGIIPTEWRDCCIVPIYKRGRKEILTTIGEYLLSTPSSSFWAK